MKTVQVRVKPSRFENIETCLKRVRKAVWKEKDLDLRKDAAGVENRKRWRIDAEMSLEDGTITFAIVPSNSCLENL